MMKKISEYITEWATNKQIKLSQREDNFLMEVSGNRANFPVLICTLEDENILVLSCLVNIKADASRAESIARGILKINFTLKYGAFQYDEKTGEVTYRLSQIIAEEDETRSKQIEETIMRAVMATDEYYEKITMILLGEENVSGDISGELS